MTPFSQALVELQLLVQKTEADALGLVASGAGRMRWEDHRTQVIGEMWRTLDRIQPGLGSKLIRAMYPGIGSDEAWQKVVADAAAQTRGFAVAAAAPARDGYGYPISAPPPAGNQASAS